MQPSLATQLAVAEASKVARLASLRMPPVAVTQPPPPFSPGTSSPRWPLFWILTAPKFESSRCQEVIASWGRMVPSDSLLFIGAAANRTSPSGHRFVALANVAADLKAEKELSSWRFVLTEFPDRDWYVKGDDDTFFVVGNLNRYLETLDPVLPYFLGCKLHLGGPGGMQYVSGGAGYVLSRGAASRLKEVLASPRCLDLYGVLGEGDLALSYCLQSAGVVPEDTRDEQGRQRFHAFSFDHHVNWGTYNMDTLSFWYHDFIWGPEREGPHCCDDNTTVSFHYMEGQMRALRFPTGLQERVAMVRSAMHRLAAFSKRLAP